MNQEIDAAIALLEEEALNSDKPPAMVVLAPDMGESILGNRGGFLRLAIAAARAAQGHNQNLDEQPWVCHEDADWQIEGLKFDDLAHFHLPEKPTRWQNLRSQVIGAVVLLLFIACFVVGIGTIASWIFGRHR
jgi:hypothetical protein